jgi:hypothetical protein
MFDNLPEIPQYFKMLRSSHWARIYLLRNCELVQALPLLTRPSHHGISPEKHLFIQEFALIAAWIMILVPAPWTNMGGIVMGFSFWCLSRRKEQKVNNLQNLPASPQLRKLQI